MWLFVNNYQLLVFIFQLNSYISRLFSKKRYLNYYNLKRNWYEEAQFLCRPLNFE